MSCSSCSRMWQCQTYSCPPVLERGLNGTLNGTLGRSNLHDDRGHLAGVHRAPSPSSRARSASGPRAAPVAGWACRCRSSASNGLAREHLHVDEVEVDRVGVPVRLAICQTSVSPAFGVSVAGSIVRPPEDDRVDQPRFVPRNWISRPILVKVLVQGELPVIAPGGRCSSPLPDCRAWRHDGSLPGARLALSVMRSGASLLVAGTTLNRMICRVFGPKPGGRGVDRVLVVEPREVVVERVAPGNGAGASLYEDDLLAGVRREVDEHVPALSRGE